MTKPSPLIAFFAALGLSSLILCATPCRAYSRPVASPNDVDGYGDGSHQGRRQPGFHTRSNRRLQNRIVTDHLIRLEYSGVTYASVSLDIVKAHLVDVIEDELTLRLEDVGMELLDVVRIEGRRKRGRRLMRGGGGGGGYYSSRTSSTRRLSYIVLMVQISLRHPTWVSSERSLRTIIEILNEYVDDDFRDYVRSLPGNGDYYGSVEVTKAYNEFAIVGIADEPEPAAPVPTVVPTATGSFHFTLVFRGVPPDHADSGVLREYIRYGVMALLNDNMWHGVEAVDVCLEPYNAHRNKRDDEWLNFPMIVVLRYPSTVGDGAAFAHADDVLGENVGDVDLYLDEFIASSSSSSSLTLSYAKKAELASTMRDIFGGGGVDIEIGPDTIPATPSPTPAPTGGGSAIAKPANDWLNDVMAPATMGMPWWGWVVTGLGLAFVAVCCCCCCVVQFFTRRRGGKDPHAATTNVIRLESIHMGPDGTIHHSDVIPPGGRINNKKTSEDCFGENRKATTGKKKISGVDEEEKAHLARGGGGTERQGGAEIGVFLYEPTQSNTTDLVVFEPDPSALDPEERVTTELKSKKKKKKRKKPREP